jgi:hypothetical protein
MCVVKGVAKAVGSLVGELAEDVARECHVIKRVRKFTARTLAQTFVFGFLQNPNASDEALAQMAGLLGVGVTTQAVEQRFKPELVHFLKSLFERAVKLAVKSSKSMAPLLNRFTDVLLLDSTVISLPAELKESYPGCGGSHGGGQAAVKLQMQMSLKTGAFDEVKIEAGRDNDMRTSLQQQKLPPGALRITDLGYFNTAVFQRYEKEGTFWLSRLLYGTNVYDLDGNQLSLMRWLGSQGLLVDQRVQIGAERKVECRIIAHRLSSEASARRRQKLIDTYRKKGRTPSAERIEWCDWIILVTNVPQELLNADEAFVLYRARWQVELLFKRWKSQGQVDKLVGSTIERKMARMWSRLLAVLVQHWLILASTWGKPRISLKKAYDAVRKFSVTLAMATFSEANLCETIARIIDATKNTARQNKRKSPSTFELLNDPGQLKYA